MDNSNLGFPSAPLDPAGSTTMATWQVGLLRWMRRILASNPFYLASAGFVLYGINRLSSDPRLTGAETALLGFNFGALFFYELLLVITAIVLARRAIWYDALVLVGLENLFVLVPFSLVSRTVLLNQHLAWAMCAAAVLLVLAKFWALQRFMPRLHFSARMLIFGGLIMAANVGIALGFQKLEFERAMLMRWLNVSWLILLPLVVFLGNLLPSRSKSEASSPMCKWFPEGMVGIWLAVTAVHLGGVGYVFEFEWQLALLAPALWALAWTLLNRTTGLMIRHDFVRSLIWAPLLVTVIAIQNGLVFTTLNVLNFIVYGLLYTRQSQRRLLLHLCLCSLTAALAGIPVVWGQQILSNFSRGPWIFFCLIGFFTAWTAFTSDPRAAIFGSIGVLIITGSVILVESPGNLGLQAACVFFIAHSLRWRDDQHRGAAGFRILCLLLWVGHSYWWGRTGSSDSMATIYSFAGLILALCCARGLLTDRWRPLVIPVAAMLVLFSAPCNLLAGKLKAVSPAYLALIAGFLLFGLGTWLAFTKARWKSHPVQAIK